MYVEREDVDGETLLEIYNAEADRIAYISQVYRLADWVAINKMSPLDIRYWVALDKWNERFGLDEVIMKAIAKEVEELARRIAREKEEIKKSFESSLQFNKGLQFPKESPSTITKFFT